MASSKQRRTNGLPTFLELREGAGRGSRRNRGRATSTLLLAGCLLGGLGFSEAAALEVAQFGEAGFLAIDYQLQARVGMRDLAADPASGEDTLDFYVRRNRLSFIGAADETFGAVVQVEYNGGQQLGDTTVLARQRDFELVLLDAFVTADLFEFLKVRAGRTKHALTREVQEGCYDPLSIDRSPFVTGPFSQHAAEKTTRDVGLVLWGNAWERTFQYRLAVMQGNRFGDGMPGDIGLRYTGRVHATFFGKEGGIVYKGTYLGKKRVLTIGAGYELQPNAVYSSGTTGAEHYRAYTADLFAEEPTDYGTFTLSAAYLRTDFGEAGVRRVPDAQGVQGERNGYYWKAGYMLGPVQVFGRFERWSFASLNGVLGQELQWWVGGVNVYVKGQDLRFTLEYAASGFEKAPSRDFHTILFQGQARL